jgi:membrane-associated phospholipid phosphatase
MRPCDDAKVRVRVAAGCLAALAMLTVLVVGEWGPLERLDLRASEQARRFGDAHPAWVETWRVITHVGDTLPLLVVAVVLVAVPLVQGSRREAVLVLLAAGGTHLAWLAIRAQVARPRPVDGFTYLDSWAFPSGHTVHAATAALVTVHLIWPYLGNRARWAAASAAALVAALVGVSRVMLLAHWPSDVLGGWLLVLGTVPLLFAVSDAAEEAQGPSPAACGRRR